MKRTEMMRLGEKMVEIDKQLTAAINEVTRIGRLKEQCLLSMAQLSALQSLPTEKLATSGRRNNRKKGQK